MSAAKYFVISSGESGIHIDELTAAGLKKRIGEDYYGTKDRFYGKLPRIDGGHFLERDSETALLVIKGEIVVPTPKKVVTEFEIP